MATTTRKLFLTVFFGLLGGLALVLVALKILAHYHGAGTGERPESNFHNGDIIFQTSRSSQSEAIQLATHSKYSHCGLIFWEHGQCYVIEAAGTVTWTPIKKFIDRGKDGKYVVKRLKNSEEIFTGPEVLREMTKLFYDRFEGKPYDLYFEWSDDRIYCSELVWKIYKETTGIEIGELQALREFDLTSLPVKQKMDERYKGNIPLDEVVISPAAMFESDKLVTVLER